MLTGNKIKAPQTSIYNGNISSYKSLSFTEISTISRFACGVVEFNFIIL